MTKEAGFTLGPGSHRWLLLGLVLLALLRLLLLDQSSLWYDELHTALATAPGVSWQQFWDRWIIPDVHPPLFYLLVYTGQKAGLTSDFLLRLWPFAFSWLFILVVWLRQRRLMKPDAFFVYLLLVSASPFVIYYGAELRSYSLMYCLAVMATAFFHSLLVSGNRVILLDSIGLAVCFGLLALTHYFSAFLIVAVYGYLIVVFRRSRKDLIRLLLPALIAGLPALAWFFFHYSSLAGRGGGNFWISNSPGNFAVFFILQFAGGFAGTLAIIVGLVLAASDRSHWSSPFLHVALLAMALAIVVGLHTPMITPRNLLIFTPLVLLWLASDLALTVSQPKKVLAGVCILLLLVQSVIVLLVDRKQNWRAASVYVEEINPKGCPIPYEHKYDPYMRIQTRQLYGYYFSEQSKASLVKGPVDTEGCPILYFVGQADWKQVEKQLQKLGVDYRFRDFNYVRVYIKKAQPEG